MTTVAHRDVTAEFRSIVENEMGASDLVGVWLTHRVCAPEHAEAVLRRCVTDRRVLPRWHQDDRGERNSVRGWHEPDEPGDYAGIPVWPGRAKWLAETVPAAIEARGEVLRAHRLSPATFLRWATVKSGYAASRTGRRCIATPKGVASVMGCTPRTVQTCARVARELGLEVVVREGRMLSVEERKHCQAMGSTQRGLATVVALTVPEFLRASRAASPVDNRSSRPGSASSISPLPEEGLLPRKATINSHPHRASADGRKDAAPRRPRNEGIRNSRVRAVAVDLCREVGWLAEEAPGRLIPALTRFVCHPTMPWTAADLLEALPGVSRAGVLGIFVEEIRTRPAALLAALLRRLDPERDHPIHRRPLIPPKPCGLPGCDGHGWVETIVTVRGHDYHTVRACPHCPPDIRRPVFTPAPITWPTTVEENPGTSAYFAKGAIFG